MRWVSLLSVPSLFSVELTQFSRRWGFRTVRLCNQSLSVIPRFRVSPDYKGNPMDSQLTDNLV